MTSSTTPAWILTTVSDGASPGCDAVREWLREYNWSTNRDFMEKREWPEHHAQPLALLASVDSGTVGGLFAETQFAWLRISIMAVAAKWRSRGVGAGLLAEAERQACARGCKYAYVDTMDYQAPGFYLAHGYAIAGEIPDWDSHGHRKLYLTKQLSLPAGTA